MSYIPMMGGRWRAMSGVQSARFRQHLDTACATPGGPALGGAILGPVRYLVLSCYPGWVLIEADLAAGAGEIATVNLMYGPGVVWLVDGTSARFHLLNTGQLDSDAATEISALATLDAHATGPVYLRLFCSAVWGAEGPFAIIDDDTHPALAGSDGRRAWRDQLTPLSMRADGDGLVADAVVGYGQDLFRARFRIIQGLVAMEDDEMIARGVLAPRRHRAPLRDLRPAAEA